MPAPTEAVGILSEKPLKITNEITSIGKQLHFLTTTTISRNKQRSINQDTHDTHFQLKYI